nr:hypothetical protein [uncultured Mediterranean phage uvMED]BAR23566.1 hypothetical protein [uncultured Mediterranean phage uvMED]
MKIQIRKQVTLSGQVVRIGEVVEASPTDAQILFGQAAAVVYEEPVTEPEVAPVECPMPKAEAKPKATSRRRTKS